MVLFPLSPKVNGGMTLIIINVPQCFLVEACGLGRVNNWHFLKLDTLQRTLGQNPSTEGIDGQKGKGSAEEIVLTEGIISTEVIVSIEGIVSTEGIVSPEGIVSTEGIVLTEGIESVRRPSQIYFSL